MKQFFLVLFVIISTACTASPPPNKSLAIIAHRGGAGLAPENTLAAFRNGLALGADFLEMDAQLTQDGILVIIHDDTIDRTTDGKGRVADFTLQQIQLFNAAAKYANGTTERQAIPTFVQVLDLAKPTRARLEVEIKVPAQGRYAGIEEKMIDALEEIAMIDRVQISSFDFNVLRDVKKFSPRTRTVALLTFDYFRANDISQPTKIIEQIQGISAELIAINKDLLAPPLVQEAHRRKMQVEAWTVDREDEMKKFIAMGVDGIITNRPDTLKRVLAR